MSGVIYENCTFEQNTHLNAYFKILLTSVKISNFLDGIHIDKEHQNVRSFKTSFINNEEWWGFPGGAVVESLPADAGDTGSSPGLGGSHMPRSN